MKIPSNSEERQKLLRKLRRAVHAQIELWDLVASIAEEMNAELDPVLQFCQATAIHADIGKELGQTNLQDLLDYLAGTLTAKIWVGKPLENH